MFRMSVVVLSRHSTNKHTSEYHCFLESAFSSPSTTMSGSQIEPGDTYGFDYLISTKKYSSMFKQKQDNIPDSLLQKALQLYNMRKDGSATKEQADTILNDILKYLDNNIA